MKTYTPQELIKVLELHRKWRAGYDNGTRADLCGADLRGADLCGADLRDADLRGANLCDADLCDADLRGANLRGANLRGADLRGANTSTTKLPAFLIVPQQGAFIAWKKAGGKVVRMEIPADAHRTSTPVGRKCRAEFVRVLDIDGDSTPGLEVRGSHDPNTRYVVGEITRPDKYDDDWRVECASGIHFFITYEEAKGYWE